MAVKQRGNSINVQIMEKRVAIAKKADEIESAKEILRKEKDELAALQSQKQRGRK